MFGSSTLPVVGVKHQATVVPPMLQTTGVRESAPIEVLTPVAYDMTKKNMSLSRSSLDVGGM
jgi:hypothetical protein